MQTAEDLYAEDNEELNLEDLERYDDGDGQEADIDEAEEAPASEPREDEAEENKEKKVVKPKRVIKNPQPKLNIDTLRGPRGLMALEKHFSKVKYKGKGHEEEDLNVILKSYEYWCHRLFPKFPFGECISRIEKLGSKKAVQTYVKRIRMDVVLEDELIHQSDNESNADHQEQENIDHLFTPVDSTQQTAPTLSAEQLERIRLNREKAEEIRRQRLRKIQEQAREHMPSATNSQSQDDDDIESRWNTIVNNLGQGDSTGDTQDSSPIDTGHSTTDKECNVTEQECSLTEQEHSNTDFNEINTPETVADSAAARDGDFGKQMETDDLDFDGITDTFPPANFNEENVLRTTDVKSAD